jgi:hypothetical protein
LTALGADCRIDPGLYAWNFRDDAALAFHGNRFFDPKDILGDYLHVHNL